MPGNSGSPARSRQHQVVAQFVLDRAKGQAAGGELPRSAPSVVGTDIRQYKPVARIPWTCSKLLSLSEPVVIAHRGGSRLRPENTAHLVRSRDRARRRLRSNVMCTFPEDGEPVVIHDRDAGSHHGRRRSSRRPAGRRARAAGRGLPVRSRRRRTVSRARLRRAVPGDAARTVSRDADRHRDQGRPSRSRRAGARRRRAKRAPSTA